MRWCSSVDNLRKGHEPSDGAMEGSLISPEALWTTVGCDSGSGRHVDCAGAGVWNVCLLLRMIDFWKIGNSLVRV
jgi:hypothetical protein